MGVIFEGIFGTCRIWTGLYFCFHPDMIVSVIANTSVPRVLLHGASDKRLAFLNVNKFINFSTSHGLIVSGEQSTALTTAAPFHDLRRTGHAVVNGVSKQQVTAFTLSTG
jgi:hypothetical protein